MDKKKPTAIHKSKKSQKCNPTKLDNQVYFLVSQPESWPCLTNKTSEKPIHSMEQPPPRQQLVGKAKSTTSYPMKHSTLHPYQMKLHFENYRWTIATNQSFNFSEFFCSWQQFLTGLKQQIVTKGNGQPHSMMKWQKNWSNPPSWSQSLRNSSDSWGWL